MKARRKIRHRFFTLTISVLVLVLWGCQPKKKAVPSDKLRIVTTTGMIYDAVRNIAQDSVHLDVLMHPGVDPHLYKATQGDIRKLSEAELIFYNGLFLEGKMEHILKKMAQREPVIALAESIPEAQLRAPPGQAYSHDPHVWFDVQLWAEVVKTIGKTLQAQDPRNKAFYAANTKTYLEQLEVLDAWVRKELDSIPAPQRVLVTAHDAFGYFGDAYGIEVKGLQGISTQSDIGLDDISSLVTLIIERRIKAIFAETSVSDRAIKAVVEGCAARGYTLAIGESLYSDAMGAYHSPEGTYIGMVRANVRHIVEALK